MFYLLIMLYIVFFVRVQCSLGTTADNSGYLLVDARSWDNKSHTRLPIVDACAGCDIRREMRSRGPCTFNPTSLVSPLVLPPALPLARTRADVSCSMKSHLLTWYVFFQPFRLPGTPLMTSFRFLWILLFVQLVHSQPPTNPTSGRNGTNLMCLPFGTCEPCPEDAVRPSTSSFDASSPPFLALASRTILPAIWQPTPHALYPRTYLYLWCSISPHYTHPRSNGDHPRRDSRMGILRAHSRARAC